MEKRNINALLDFIALIGGAVLLGSVYGWEAGIGIGLLVYAIMRSNG